jgi:hypothetical protein
MSGGGSNPELPDYLREWAQPIKAKDFKAVVDARVAAEQSLAFFRKMMLAKNGRCASCQCVIAGWCLDGCLTKKEYPL